MDRAAAAWRLPTTVAGASERGIRVAMRLVDDRKGVCGLLYYYTVLLVGRVSFFVLVVCSK